MAFEPNPVQPITQDLRTQKNPVCGIKNHFLFFVISWICCVIFFSAVRAEETEPIHLTSDRLQYFKESDLLLAEGAVLIEQGLMRLDADLMQLKRETGELEARGHVRFFDGQNNIDADQIELDMETKLGSIFNGRIFLKEDNFYIEGTKIIRSAVNRYEVKEASFTACDCREDPDWHLEAERFQLTVDQFITGKNILFYAKDVPVFYLPYFAYPAGRERKTGFLVPSVGYSSRYGVRYQSDFFWAIAKNQDATLSLETRGKKGEGVGLEYRYALSNASHGNLKANYFIDEEDNVDRWDLLFHLEQRFSKRVHGKLDIRYVNENNHFQDLSENTGDRALQNIESNLILNYQTENSVAFLLARFTQDLLGRSNNATPQRLPEIGYSVVEIPLKGTPFYMNFDTGAVNFWSQAGLNLQRVDFYPKLSWPIQLGEQTTLTSWTGFRETWYSRGLLMDKQISREIIPSGLTLESNFSKKWGTFTHQANSSLMYENIMIADEADIHEFDELDQLNDRQSITFALEDRFLKMEDDGKWREEGLIRLTETYRLDGVPTGISGETQRFSDLRTEMEYSPSSVFSVRIDSFFDLDDHRVNVWNTDVQLNPSTFLNISVGQRYTRVGEVPQKGDLFNPLYLGQGEPVDQDIRFWTESIVLNTPWGVRLENRAFYDADQDELVEIDYVLNYQAQCWGLTLSYFDFHDREEFTFVITLKGLGVFDSGL
ncbi:MAG: LPS-assembly protein LptD [Nitrospiria bacterium]